MIRSIALLALFVGACTTATDDTDTDQPQCETTIEETWPTANAEDFYHRADLEIEVGNPDTGDLPTVTLEGPSGAVAGEVVYSEDFETILFTPAEPLEPGTAHTATVSTCMGDSAIPFTTSDLGLPLEVDITGATYQVSLFGGRILEPEGVGEIITTFGTPMVLIEVQAAEGTLELMGGMAEDMGPEQDLCIPTFHFPGADFSETPYFQIPEMSLAVEMGDISIVVHEFELEGTFASDGTSFGGGIVGGEIDARDLAEFIDEVETPEDLCNLAATVGASCVACSSDGEEYCLTVLIDRLQGSRVETDLVEVTDPDSNPDCAE